ncbi:hypothetical protein IWW36_001990 [Coemansia brasiliensis]|uniref:BZIP domain-containing protein n=1 Tax=Coemansia brasiliensis TaxID=2650707 RepID=A0A9W8M1G4_9FUNG|nr:hypothetical protein IWW36_001990 [Coemansia brasiliensis]
MTESRKQKAALQKPVASQEPFIVGTDFDTVNSFLELDQTQPPLQPQQGSPLENVLQGFSPQLVSSGPTVPTGFSVGGHSPAWSLSSSSNGDSSSGPRSPHVDEQMFPALPLGLNTDASLNDWLEQFVNAEALVGQSLTTLTPDMLSVLSGLCPADVAPAANIAPQQTLSKPNISAENVQKNSSEQKLGVVGVSKASSSGGKANGKRPHMVPLAPRQSTGSTTPPGLGVLAKTAQNQPPIEVKQRPIAQAHSPNARKQQIKTPPASQQQQQASNNGDAAAQKRQERLIKNRAAALLSRKRKREYLTKLESEVEELRDANATMAQRMAEMERKMNEMAQERDQLRRTAAAAAAAAALVQSPANSTSVSSTATSQKKQAESNQPASSGSQPQNKPATGCADSANQQPQQQTNKRQRTAGALLMAMLFSFSLFTLPSLYPSDSQIAVGGVQSAGVLPSSPPRLLLPAVSEQPEPEHPLVERVRRSISAFAQQKQQQSRLEDDEPQARAANTSAEADMQVRPLTMEQSADLHAWIRRGLKASEKSRNNEQQTTSSSLAVVDRRASPSSSQLDYAMLYCPSMKHVMFSSDAQQVAEVQHEGGKIGSARVLDATGGPGQQLPLPMEDVDEAVEIQASPRVERSTASKDVSLLLPTHDSAAAAAAAAAAALPVRPKLSLYSPVVTSNAESHQHILPPWEEYARLSDPSADSVRQKYLRIDVEVVGSKWVTADKFANGLY